MWILISVFFGGLIVFHLLEPLAPVRRDFIPFKMRRGYIADMTAALVDGPVLSAVTKIACFWAVVHTPQIVHILGDWPWLAQFGLFFLANDLARYWLHRWYHEVEWLWRIHRVHHTAIEMDALSLFRMHILEAIIKNGVNILPFQLLGIDESVIIVYSSMDILKGFWHHANLRTYIGPFNYFFNSAELHWWHHAADGPGQHRNYGSILSIWDWLFGTAFWPRGEWPEKVGVNGLDNFPNTYYGQLATVAMSDDEALRRFGPTSNETTPARNAESQEESAETERDERAPVASPA